MPLSATGAAQRQKAKWGGLAARTAGPYNIALQERPQDWLTLPEDQWVKSTDIQAYGNVKGCVFRENEVGVATAGGVTAFAGDDVALPNEVVVGSYLRDEVGKKIDEWKANNQNYRYDDLVAAEKQIINEWNADPANADKPAIAETVWTRTDNDGRYTLQFKGQNPDGSIASSPSDGTFIAGQKKINTDYMYVYPVLTKADGDPDTSENGANMRTMGGAYFSNIVNNAQLATILTAGRSDVISVNFAVNNGFPTFAIPGYNVSDKPAAPGTTVTAKATSFKSEMPYRVEWYVDGQMVDGASTQATTDRYGNLPDQTFTVPVGTPENSIVQARIFKASETDAKKYESVAEFRVGPAEAPATTVVPGAKDTVPNTGKVVGPTDGLTGTLVDGSGNPVKGATVTIDKDGKVVR